MRSRTAWVGSVTSSVLTLVMEWITNDGISVRDLGGAVAVGAGVFVAIASFRRKEPDG